VSTATFSSRTAACCYLRRRRRHERPVRPTHPRSPAGPRLAGAATSYTYDRNRLQSSASGGQSAGYNYDPYGRLDTITSAGTVVERNTYDGFDHITQNTKLGSGGTSTTTTYTFDPLDRTASKTTAGKTTDFSYLGLSSQVLDETVAGQLTKSYQYSPWGERLSQTTHNTDSTTTDAYYGYNSHTDVETLTDNTGQTTATYGYTAYGNNDTTEFTGIDKPVATDPTKTPYNAYRFNAKRWDAASGTYDMGFRTYDPGLNTFTTRDMYNGALADMNLSTNPLTGNRYAFGGGNPTTNIELDGHMLAPADGGGGGPVDPSLYFSKEFQANVATDSRGNTYRLGEEKGISQDEIDTRSYLNDSLRGANGFSDGADGGTGQEYRPVNPIKGQPRGNGTADLVRLTWNAGKLTKVEAIDIYTPKGAKDSPVPILRGLSGKEGQADEVVLNYKTGTSEKIEALQRAIIQRGLRFNNVRIISQGSNYDSDLRLGMKGTALGLQDGDAMMLPDQNKDDGGGGSGGSGGSGGGSCGPVNMASFTSDGCGGGGEIIPGPSFPGFCLPSLGDFPLPFPLPA
jgi:RHS repeat-associated protein